MGELALARRREGAVPGFVPVRWLQSLAWAAFLAHIACAFQFYHHWSHAQAWADTARQTKEQIGWDWGGGLWFNYLFAVLWTCEVAWMWLDSKGHRERRKWVGWSVRSLFLFMLFNGALLFAHGPLRWLGLMLCVALVWAWLPSRTRLHS